MKSKTIVCAYGKNEPVITVFERLYAMYVSNYSRNYVYCALIDLPDGISYRTAGDQRIEDDARTLVNRLLGAFGGRLMCAIRQRRTQDKDIGHIYVCEGGTKGALGALWRHSKGKDEGLFPIYGCDETLGAERIYFSCAPYPPEPNGELGESGFIDVIEPNGIFGLVNELSGNDAVFVFAGDVKQDAAPFNERCHDLDARIGEGLYTSDALDRLICASPAHYDSRTCKGVGLVKYPKGSFSAFYGEK